MSHKNKKSLIKQVTDILLSKLAVGESKHVDKLTGETQDKIYSYGTLKSYIKQCSAFVKYCKKLHKCKTVKECRIYVDEYLQREIDRGLSPYTIKLKSAAIAKLYGVRTLDFIPTPPRKRANITRSRKECVRDKHFSEKNNADLVAFCKGTGLRRRELAALTGDKLILQKGKYYILVTNGKGGKRRAVPIIDNEDVIVPMMRAAGRKKVFKSIPGAADIHGYRAEYATNFYNKIARPINHLAYEQIYFCRRDRVGVAFDRKAMLVVSIALGHNRINVIAGHYLFTHGTYNR